MSKTIINGIDVSECSYYNKDNAPYCCEVWDNECEAQNCYFKQLKHLQQENKKLKEVANEAKIEYENLLINRNDFAERAEKLEQENKELKETVENLLKIQYALADSCNKYSKVIEEIREMLETCLKFTTCEKCKFYKKCNKDIEECIITMINEVLK